MMHLQRPAWILPEVNGKQSARTMALEQLDVFCNSFTDQYGLAEERLYTYKKILWLADNETHKEPLIQLIHTHKHCLHFRERSQF